ncbi:MAG: hypothetical protein IKS99_01895 [Firmicutes bacterium]|nr:hypothetical protein [Bacillota bacterium]
MKIICIGDSLTYGYGVWQSKCWVTLLSEATGIRALNHGINGDTSGYMLERSRRHVIPDKADPGDIVIVMGGANDVLMYGANENDASNIIMIAELALAKNCKPVIGIQPGFKPSDYPFYGPLDPAALNEDFNRFAELVREGAKARGIAIFDLRPVLEDASLFNDGVHPTDEGHRLIADTVLDTIKPLL